MNGFETIGSNFINLSAMLTAAACLTLGTTAHAAEATEAEILEGTAKWDAAFNAGNADAISQLYAADATMVPPTGTTVTGQAAIREFWAGLFKAGFTGHKIDLVSIRNTGDVTIAVAKWQANGPGENGTVKQYSGQLVNILQTQKDGQRRSILHTWN